MWQAELEWKKRGKHVKRRIILACVTESGAMFVFNAGRRRSRQREFPLNVFGMRINPTIFISTLKAVTSIGNIHGTAFFLADISQRSSESGADFTIPSLEHLRGICVTTVRGPVQSPLKRTVRTFLRRPSRESSEKEHLANSGALLTIRGFEVSMNYIL